MDVCDLSRSQLDYLKTDYMWDVHHETVMDASDMVTDDEVIEHYAGTTFTYDDFGFGPQECEGYYFGREIHDGYSIERMPEFDNCFVVIINVDDDTRLVVNTHETEWPEARDAAWDTFESLKLARGN